MAALAIPAALWLFLPDMSHYRGLSGLDAALFALLAGRVLLEGRQEGDRLRVGAAATALAALGAKVVYELATGDALFLDQGAAGFVPVPLAHAHTVAAGLLAALPWRLGAEGSSPPSFPPTAHSRPRAGLWHSSEPLR